MLPYILLPRHFKLTGLLLFIGAYIVAYYTNPDFNTVTNGPALLVQVMLLTGLLFIACAKEKVEDEMIRHIRLTSLQYAVVIFVLLRLGYKVTGYLTADESWMPHFQANFLVMLYIAIFYFQSRLKPWLHSLKHRAE